MNYIQIAKQCPIKRPDVNFKAVLPYFLMLVTLAMASQLPAEDALWIFVSPSMNYSEFLVSCMLENWKKIQDAHWKYNFLQ